MLWNFFQQALASPLLNVDAAFRQMLNLSRSFPGCRPFANEPAPAAEFFVDKPISSAVAVAALLETTSRGEASTNRLAQIKLGSTLNEVATRRSTPRGGPVKQSGFLFAQSRSRTSLAQDIRNIKKVGAVCYALRL